MSGPELTPSSLPPPSFYTALAAEENKDKAEASQQSNISGVSWAGFKAVLRHIPGLYIIPQLPSILSKAFIWSRAEKKLDSKQDRKFEVKKIEKSHKSILSRTKTITSKVSCTMFCNTKKLEEGKVPDPPLFLVHGLNGSKADMMALACRYRAGGISGEPPPYTGAIYLLNTTNNAQLDVGEGAEAIQEGIEQALKNMPGSEKMVLKKGDNDKIIVNAVGFSMGGAHIGTIQANDDKPFILETDVAVGSPLTLAGGGTPTTRLLGQVPALGVGIDGKGSNYLKFVATKLSDNKSTFINFRSKADPIVVAREGSSYREEGPSWTDHPHLPSSESIAEATLKIFKGVKGPKIEFIGDGVALKSTEMFAASHFFKRGTLEELMKLESWE